jgi:hypothetical protein
VIVIFYRFGVATLVFALAMQTFLMWPIAVRMVLRILKIGAWAYLRSFLAPTLACLVMLAGVLVLKQYMAGTSAYLRLAGEVTGGAVIYCAALVILDGRRIVQMRDIVLKRGIVSA